jgi:hypothetical protein
MAGFRDFAKGDGVTVAALMRGRGAMNRAITASTSDFSGALPTESTKSGRRFFVQRIRWQQISLTDSNCE